MFFFNKVTFRPISSWQPDKTCRVTFCKNECTLEAVLGNTAVPCCENKEHQRIVSIQAREIWQTLKRNKKTQAA